MNIWLFMQRLNMIQHVVNLKYGFGLELNNYFYDDVRVHLYRNPTIIRWIPRLQVLIRTSWQQIILLYP